MIAYRSILNMSSSSGGGSSGASGITIDVICSEICAGLTISCSDGSTTLTSICPNNPPYTVQFNIPNSGQWVASTIIDGQIVSDDPMVIGDTFTFNPSPYGSTALPINSVKIWLRCASIYDKNYTNITEILNDNTTLTTLINSNNASDYLKRSTSWITDICQDQNAMSIIGDNNYCADLLLSDSTWRTAICNSTYFEKVLNVKVPIMTSNTEPSGIASASSVYSSSYAPYKAFDGPSVSSSEGYWCTEAKKYTNQYLRYQFTAPVTIYKIELTNVLYESLANPKNCEIQYSSDGITFTNVKSFVNSTNNTGVPYSVIIDTVNSGAYWQLFVKDICGTSNSYIYVGRLQFYGRYA